MLHSHLFPRAPFASFPAAPRLFVFGSTRYFSIIIHEKNKKKTKGGGNRRRPFPFFFVAVEQQKRQRPDVPRHLPRRRHDRGPPALRQVPPTALFLARRCEEGGLVCGLELRRCPECGQGRELRGRAEGRLGCRCVFFFVLSFSSSVASVFFFVEIRRRQVFLSSLFSFSLSLSFFFLLSSLLSLFFSHFQRQNKTTTTKQASPSPSPGPPARRSSAPPTPSM